MLKKTLPLTLLVALGFSAGAQAATDFGSIYEVDTVNDTVTLDDGTTFSFYDEDYADRLKSFKAGDEVSISWHSVGTKKTANSISPVTTGLSGGVAWNFVGDTADYPDHGKDHLD